jgi:hypothetical protein
MMTVLELLSIEYPIDVMACEEHAEAVALRAKGDTTDPWLAGFVTVTREKAGTVPARITRPERDTDKVSFMGSWFL